MVYLTHYVSSLFSLKKKRRHWAEFQNIDSFLICPNILILLFWMRNYSLLQTFPTTHILFFFFIYLFMKTENSITEASVRGETRWLYSFFFSFFVENKNNITKATKWYQNDIFIYSRKNFTWLLAVNFTLYMLQKLIKSKGGSLINPHIVIILARPMNIIKFICNEQ